MISAKKITPKINISPARQFSTIQPILRVMASPIRQDPSVMKKAIDLR